MNEKIFLQKLSKITKDYITNCKLSEHTTFCIGGECKVFVWVKNIFELMKILKLCKKKKIPNAVLGNGSNILADSKGFPGIVICTKKMNNIQFENNYVIAECGAMLGNLCIQAKKRGLSGVEWAVGIPATIGGAVVMNAGAFGGEMSRIVLKVEVLCNGKVKQIENKNILFNYRKSVFTNAKDCVIIKAYLKLTYCDIETIKKRTHEIIEKRHSTQRVGLPSAGSVFNNRNIPPAYMIEKSGLKELKVGDAMISPVHSGYIVNCGNATSFDVLRLIELVRNKIKVDWNENLDLEIHLLGEKNVQE